MRPNLHGILLGALAVAVGPVPGRGATGTVPAGAWGPERDPPLGSRGIGPSRASTLAAASQEAAGEEGLDEYRGDRIDFEPFRASSWDPESQRLLEAVATFVSAYRPLVGALPGETLRVPPAVEFERLKNETTAALLSIARPALVARLDRPLSEDPRVRWNQLVYQALPRHFAGRGVLVVIDRVVFGPGEGRVGALETFGLRRVDRVTPLSIEIWGDRIETALLDISSDMEADGAPVRTRPVPVAGQMVYGKVVLHRDHLEEDLSGLLADFRKVWEDPDRHGVARSEWEVVFDGLARRVIDLDPLLYSEGKLLTRLLEEVGSFEEFRKRLESWLVRQIVHHEASHVRDLDLGRYPKQEAPPPDAGSMQRWLNRWDVNYELGAYLAGARYAEERDLALEILATVQVLRNPAKPAVTRMARYAMLDAMLGEIAEHRDRYPSVTVREDPTVTARAQIAGQLYRLTPGEIVGALEAAHAWHEAHYERLDVPLGTPTSGLYATRQARASSPRRFGWVLAGVLAAAAAFATTRWRRAGRERRTDRAASRRVPERRR